MKEIKINLHKIWRKVLLAAGALLGTWSLGGCWEVMYGTPYPAYGMLSTQVSGTVKTGEGAPINNILVSMEIGGNTFDIRTLEDGSFTLQTYTEGLDLNMAITVVDTDGEANGGSFESKRLTYAELKADDNVVLEKKP